LENKLHLLYRKREYEMVGAYYRNKRMEEWVNNKELWKEYGRERNLNEGFNSYLKQHAGFDSNLPRKGRKIAFFHTTLCLISLNLVALTRLQNGVTENLISVAYLT